MNPRQEKIIEIISITPGITHNKLYEECGGSAFCAKATFDKDIKELIDSGLLSKRPVGKQKRGYWTADLGSKYDRLLNQINALKEIFEDYTKLASSLLESRKITREDSSQIVSDILSTVKDILLISLFEEAYKLGPKLRDPAFEGILTTYKEIWQRYTVFLWRHGLLQVPEFKLQAMRGGRLRFVIDRILKGEMHMKFTAEQEKLVGKIKEKISSLTE